MEYGESAEAQSFIAKYEWHDVVGAGSYSSVHRAFEKRTGRPVAIKVIKKEILTPDVEAQIINEAVRLDLTPLPAFSVPRSHSPPSSCFPLDQPCRSYFNCATATRTSWS